MKEKVSERESTFSKHLVDNKGGDGNYIKY